MSAIASIASVGEFERDALGRHQRDVLLDQRGLGLGQDAAEIVARQRLAARRGSAAGPAARAAGPTASTTWNAPEAMNRMWSVFTAPCLVETVVPSISGSRSRCTPSRDTSAPTRPSRAGDLVDLVEEHDAVLLDRA